MLLPWSPIPLPKEMKGQQKMISELLIKSNSGVSLHLHIAPRQQAIVETRLKLIERYSFETLCNIK